MKVNIEKIEDVLMKSLEDACGLTAYKKVLDKSNINSSEYQKNFTNYYKVRRDANWREKFYKYLDDNKDNTSITFEEILKKLLKSACCVLPLISSMPGLFFTVFTF